VTGLINREVIYRQMPALFWCHALVVAVVLTGLVASRFVRRADVVWWHRAWSGFALIGIVGFLPAVLQSWSVAVSAGGWLFRAALLVYAGGTALLLIRLAAGLLLVRRLAARGVRLEGPWRTRLRALVGEDAERCRAHARVQVPLAVGGRDPIVLLPEGWVRWDDGRVGAVVRHELAHLDRRDFGWNVVGALFEACYWPNPLTWVVTRRLRLLAECACDRRAADHVGAEAYVTVLVASAREHRARGPHARILAPGAVTDLEARIAALLS
jgi:hypothetical protein